MNKIWNIAAASALVGFIGYLSIPNARGADERKDRQEQRQANLPLTLPQGFKQKDTSENKAIASELATVTDDALSENHFDNFLNNLVDEDRTRLKPEKRRDMTDLNGKIKVIHQFWKDKYGHDFNIKKRDELGTGVMVVMGEVADPARAVMNWPVDPRTGQAMQKSKEAIAASSHEAGKNFGGRVNLDKGRNVALVRDPESHGLPAVTASLIHEMPAQWRFDIPNDRTGDQIYNDLLNQLNSIATHSAEWPSDEKDAYAMTTHHVLLALYGVDANMRAPGDRQR
jgi:hypothetical protein